MRTQYELSKIKEFAKEIVRENDMEGGCLLEEHVENLVLNFLDDTACVIPREGSIITEINLDGSMSSFSNLPEGHPLDDAADKMLTVWTSVDTYELIDILYNKLMELQGELNVEVYGVCNAFLNKVTGKWYIVFNDQRLSAEFDTEDEALAILSVLKEVNTYESWQDDG